MTLGLEGMSQQMIFETSVCQFLEELADCFEALGQDVFEDVSLYQGVLEVTLLNGQKVLINKHTPTAQVWYSSPLSGAWHFFFKDGQWLCTKDNDLHFIDLLEKELAALTGKEVKVKHVS